MSWRVFSQNSVHKRLPLVLVNGIHDRRESVLIKRTSRHLYLLCDPPKMHTCTPALWIDAGSVMSGSLYLFGARWGEERNRCAEEAVMLEPCWRCAGSLGWSVRAAAGSNGCHSNWEWWTTCWQDGRGCMLIGAEAAGERSGCGTTRHLCKSEKKREGEVERKRYRWRKMYICGSAFEIGGWSRVSVNKKKTWKGFHTEWGVRLR